ncbi:cob(I)yrinic acid a,c-diamide adenosyltransferase [Pleionea mediterranea]|jgi:cob(I)alamin adenosyltransferase|uniref:Corrinoid adenosyltransferase n=1 Tax=Pleionea mediterranea TaxID=523701 RepID=A0A316FSZ3_9GAMM|nr:cob(I)yrinic acid a,c-diamide adenosyltransferase [Pleionea mediterranea]PWK50740.1 ATP:cob(I)alamin adenosyltransferase [Pleionea mediterranea]
MGNRLSKLVTKTGDDGTTGIGQNRRVEKDSARIEAIGTVDELNSSIGMIIAHPVDKSLAEKLEAIQHILFNLGGELAMPEYQLVKDDDLSQIEQWLEQLNDTLPPLKEFILPKGDMPTACCHMARTICRRAERRIVTLARNEEINKLGQTYLNRLSDFLFVCCRILGRNAQVEEKMWQSERNQ